MYTRTSPCGGAPQSASTPGLIAASGSGIRISLVFASTWPCPGTFTLSPPSVISTTSAADQYSAPLTS